MKKCSILAALPLLVSCATVSRLSAPETETIQSKTKALIECVKKEGRPVKLGYKSPKYYELKTEDADKQNMHRMEYSQLNPEINNDEEYLRVVTDIGNTVVDIIDNNADGSVDIGLENIFENEESKTVLSSEFYRNLLSEQKNIQLAPKYQEYFAKEIDYFLNLCKALSKSSNNGRNNE